MRATSFLAGAAAILLSASVVSQASAATIIDDWSKVQVPAAPELKSANLDAKTTALLLLDFNGAQDPKRARAIRRPSRAASLRCRR